MASAAGTFSMAVQPALYKQRVYAAGKETSSEEAYNLYETDLTTDQTRQINEPDAQYRTPLPGSTG